MAIGTELQIKQHCVCFCRWIFILPQGDFLRAHAETTIKSHELERLEKLVRYIVPVGTASETHWDSPCGRLRLSGNLGRLTGEEEKLSKNVDAD